ncbi:MAG: AAA family ATPase, partial [Clostridiales bacterium]|nr:AAA family ATPase [Clostridiales bacterium]
MISELTYKELKPSFDLKYIKEQLEQKTSAVAVIGQPRAERALSFGLRTRAEGYNIYVSGPVDSGRISAVMKLATEAAEKLPPPPDICCVYNFDDAKTPVLLTFPAGGGRDFKTDMEELIELVKMDIRQTFASPEFEDVKNSIVRKYRDGRDLIIKEITKEAKEYNFGVKSTTAGVYFVPIIDGEIISEEQYDALPEEVKNAINKQSGEVQSQTAGILRRMRQFDRAVVTDVGNFEFSSALFAIGQRFVAIIEKYYNNPKVCEYVKKVKEDILENFDDFFEQ